MSELPHAEELPRTEEGYDPERVEAAFATFADRVRELEDVAAELRSELRSLRAERFAGSQAVAETWPDEAGTPAFAPDWVGSVPPPLPRGLAVPRLALEAVFLLLVALLAGLADLSPEWIVGVMAAAWALVALSEWAAAAKRARWRLEEIPPAVAEPAGDATGPWDMPVVQATVVDAPEPEPESETVVTTLPVDPESVEEADEEEPEPAKPPRRLFRRRRAEAEPVAADPWER